jgi:hypothetical protein
MATFIRKTGFRVGVQVFMVLLVVGIFLAACGSDNPFSLCSSGYTYCSSSGKCCPSDKPFHCDSAGSSADYSGQCRSVTWTTDLCGSQDKCTG